MPSTQAKLPFPRTKRRSVITKKNSQPEDEKRITVSRSASRRRNCDSSDNENVSSPTKGASAKRLSNHSCEGEENVHVSPPKRDKLSGETGHGSSPSPSSSLAKLHLSDEKSDDKNEEKGPLSPKCLFGKESSYRRARQALHSSAPALMLGRERQMKELTDYISEKLRTSSSGTLYMSGPPGTGKTACLLNILKYPKFQDECKSIYINCTSMKSSGCIYSRICEELRLKSKGRSEKECLKTLKEFWASNRKMILLVLDEIDQLESKKQAVLYTIFEWPSEPGARLVLIGIANALDLTDRILPRLQAHVKLKPKLMHFAPYSKDEIVLILVERLKEMDVLDIFSPVAIQLLAGKVASVSGDVRRALDIGRRVLELAELQKLQDVPLKPTTDHSSNTSSPRKKRNASIDLKVVMNVLNSVYGVPQFTANETNETTDDTFPLQQKLLVCSLVLLLKKGKTKDVSVGKLHDVYRQVCKKRNISAVDLGEFFSLCQLVETRGILQVQVKKEARMAKVRLMWDEEEIASALQDKQLLATILNDTLL